MPVFFVHDTARGIITPLDKKFRVREIQATDELSETPATHDKLQPDANETPTKNETSEQHEQAPTPQTNENAKQLYQQTQKQNELRLGTVKSIMSSPVLTIDLDHTLAEAWKTLQKYEICHLVIVDRHNKLCGVLSEKSLLPYLMGEDALPPANTPLDIFCEQTVLSTSPETLVEELAEALLEHGLDGVPVTDGGQVVGIVTYSDILKIMLKSHAFKTCA